MRSSLLAALLLIGCPAVTEDTGGTEGDADTDTDSDTDTDTDIPQDRDGDGFTNDIDCDDSRDDVNPDVASDVCNGRDDDCDEEVDEDPDLTWYLDADGDGFGKEGGSSFVACEAGSDSYASNDADCDDDDGGVYPGADDVCDAADNDCDGSTDEDESYWEAFYLDEDGDGAGVDELVYGCDAASAGGATNTWDCDDDDDTEPVFVATTGSSRGTGLVDSPLSSIQSAIYQASTCVKVAAGEYTEDIDFGGQEIVVESLDGADATIITGTGGGPVVTFWGGESADAILRGFTITGGAGYMSESTSSYWDGRQYIYSTYTYYYGGGLYISSSSPTLEELVVTQNLLPEPYGYYASDTEYYYTLSQGGGLYVTGGSPTLTDVDITENSAAYGSALYHVSSGTLRGTRVRVLENSGAYGTIYQYYADEGWENLLLNANTSDYGYAGFYTSYATLTMYNSALLSGDFGLYSYGSDITLDSSVVSGNAAGLQDEEYGASQWSLSYNNVYANGGNDLENVDDPTGTSGNLSTSSGFTSYRDDDDSADDLTLSSTSALIDAGNPSSSRADTDGSTNDIGVYGGPNGSWP